MTLKNILIGLGLVVLGVGLGRYATPVKTIEKEHIIYQDKIVVKEVESKTTNKKDDKVYTKTEVVNKDGSKTTVTKIVDKDNESSTDNTNKDTTNTINSTTDKSTTTYYGSNVLISLGIDTERSYNLLIQKKLFGPFYVGLFGTSKPSLGCNIGIGL